MIIKMDPDDGVEEVTINCENLSKVEINDRIRNSTEDLTRIELMI